MTNKQRPCGGEGHIHDNGGKKNVFYNKNNRLLLNLKRLFEIVQYLKKKNVNLNFEDHHVLEKRFLNFCHHYTFICSDAN